MLCRIAWDQALRPMSCWLPVYIFDWLQGDCAQHYGGLKHTNLSALQAFDVVIEASGSSQGITLAAAICRPMGTIVLKSSEHATE